MKLSANFSCWYKPADYSNRYTSPLKVLTVHYNAVCEIPQDRYSIAVSVHWGLKWRWMRRKSTLNECGEMLGRTIAENCTKNNILETRSRNAVISSKNEQCENNFVHIGATNIGWSHQQKRSITKASGGQGIFIAGFLSATEGKNRKWMPWRNLNSWV